MAEEWERKLRTLSRLEPAPHLLEKAKEGPRHPTVGSPLRSRIGTAIVAFAVFGVAAAFAWIAFRPDEPRRTVALAPGEIQRIRLDGPPQPIAVGEGAAWVQVGGVDEPFVLWRIDAVTGEAKPLPRTEEMSHPAVGEGFVWAVCEEEFPECGGNWLLKLDANTGRILARIRLPGYPSQPQVGLGAVWVPTRSGLVKVDPDRTAILRVLPGNYVQVGIAGRFVWATTFRRGPDRLSRIDPETGVVTRLDVPEDPCILEASGDAVWVATCRSVPPYIKREEILTKLDANAGDVLLEEPLEASGDMRVVGESLWMAYFNDAGNIDVVSFDLTSGQPSGHEFSIRRGGERFIGPGIGGPVGPNVAADDYSLWISEFYAGEVIRLGLPVEGSGPPPDTAPRKSPIPAPTPQPTSSPGPEDGAQTCDFPSFQPTYLPWLKENEPVPEPEAFYGHGDSAILYWSWPGSSTKYVTLTRQSTQTGGSGPGEHVNVAIEGAESGQLYEGEGVSGDELIYWNSGGAVCSEIVLELSAVNDLSREESKAVIRKIARSLRPRTPPSPSE